MSSTTSSHERIDKVSSDNLVIGFDLLSNLTYMWVLSTGSLSRSRIVEQCGRQSLKTAVFFRHIHVAAERMKMSYSQAFQIVSAKARASSVKSLLLRFAAALSSGESEREFIAQEATTEAERFGNEYERSVENLRKWTDAYAAVLISVTLIMVVSLVSTLMGSLDSNFIIIMAFTLFFITSIGVYIIKAVAPVEKTPYDSPRHVKRQRRLARRLLFLLGPVGLASAALVVSEFELLIGFASAFLIIGVSLLPTGYYAWKDDGAVRTLDAELHTFLRSVGNVAGATGSTLTESLKTLDTRSMGSLGPHIDRLKVRLSARLPTHDCWERFRQETGSDLVSRTTHMLVDGSELAGRPDKVGQICSNFALKVTQLRATRALTASTFSFLVLPMHATMTFILVFVLQIVTTFNDKLSSVSPGAARSAQEPFNLSDSVTIPPGLPLPQRGDLGGAGDIFGSQDLTLVTYTILLVIVILTVANALAPKFAAGGGHVKIASFLSIMLLISGAVLGVVPFITSKLFGLN